jgi:hypothetical protein
MGSSPIAVCRPSTLLTPGLYPESQEASKMRSWLSTVFAARLAVLGLATVALALATDASAHHSQEYFDADTIVTVQGRLARLDFRNPHVYLYVEVTEAGGETVEWRIESHPVRVMLAGGWTKDSLRPGEQVTIEAHPVRNAQTTQRYARLAQVTKEDGTVLASPSGGGPLVAQ